MGPDTNTTYDGYDPDVVYNSVDNEFMVVWIGEEVPRLALPVEASQPVSRMKPRSVRHVRASASRSVIHR